MQLPFQHELRPAQDRVEPPIWVNHVYLWQDIDAEPVQSVPLDRGLNVVWSPVRDSDDPYATGHAAGKTLFCRLIRYCLGEDSFADPDDTQAIRARFPAGAVGLVVRLRGESWTVRRRFRLPHEDLAARGDTPEGLRLPASANYDDFLAAVRRAAMGTVHLSLAQEAAEEDDPWLFLLAWLTRDQECRLDGLTHWRHPESSSQSPVRHARHEQRLLLLRTFADLYTAEQAAQRAAVQARTDAHRRAQSNLTTLRSRFSSVRAELAHALALDVEAVWPDGAPAEAEFLGRHRVSLDAQARARIRAFAKSAEDPRRREVETVLADTEEAVARLDSRVSQLEAEWSSAKAHVELVESRHEDAATKRAQARHPTCPYDDAPIDVPAAQFVCPLPRLPNEVAAADALREQEQALALARQERNRIAEQLEIARGEHARQKRTVSTLKGQLARLDETLASAGDVRDGGWGALALIRRLFELRAEVEAATRAEAEARSSKDEQNQAQLAGLRADATSHLTRWFELLVREVVASTAEGRVVLDGAGLHPTIFWRGRRRSVALNSLQIVLFDLAALFAGVEGRGCTPGFLVHDSPREGDLDVATYERLFRVVERLAGDPSTAPFQYILTTTTDPPTELVARRVKLRLGAGKENERLFQVDL